MTSRAASVLIASFYLTTLGAEAVKPPPGMVVGSVSQPLTAADGTTYLIFLPNGWSPHGASYPVMLFMHGVGGINNGAGCRNPGLTTQFPLMDPEYAATVPHIVLVPVAAKQDWRHHFDASMALVDMAINDLGGDPTRVSVAGQAMGGHGAWVFASQHPERFSAVVSICGFLDDRTSEAWSPEAPATSASVAKILKDKPTWIFHSEEDDSRKDPLREALGATIVDSEAMKTALEAAGNTMVKYTKYTTGELPPNYIRGHAAFEFAFHDPDLWPWLAAQHLTATKEEL